MIEALDKEIPQRMQDSTFPVQLFQRRRDKHRKFSGYVQILHSSERI